MVSSKNSAEKYFAARRRRIVKTITDGIAIFCAAPKKIASRDVCYPYFQDPDFYYLTSHTEPEAVLVLSASHTILYLKERNKEHERWEGELLGTKRAKSRYRIDEARDIKKFYHDLPKLLKGHSALHFVSGVDPKIDKLIYSHFSSTHGPQKNFPQKLLDARLITSEMRLVKDAHEIKTLSSACEITASGFLELFKNFSSIKTEIHGARFLETQFALHGANQTSFETIVASGKNASVLHHRASASKIKKNELVLIDAGAQFQGYAGDISRTIPASGKFSSAQADLYDLVYDTLESTIKQVKAGCTLKKLHSHAAKKLTQGLLDLKILKGGLSANLKKETYKKYFMHGIGHVLGLDVHDIMPVGYTKSGKELDFKERLLPAGACITIEPGLYFDADDKRVPKAFRGIGIRIEDDVLITKSGSRVLTKSLPKDRKSLEKLLG